MKSLPPLIFWAGCAWKRDLLERAEAVKPEGFASMSLFMMDLAAWEQREGTLAGFRSELDAREAPVICIEPYLSWYPGFDPRAVTGERAQFVQAVEADVFRFADATEASFVSLVAPYDDDVVPFDAVVEALGAFADRAATAGLQLQLEPVPTSKVPDLPTAFRLVTAVARPNVGLLLDTYNLGRGGIDPEDLHAVAHELVFALQLGDGTARPLNDDYRVDSLHNRRLPGEGELPLAAIFEQVMRKGPLPPLGPEVINDDLAALPASLAARRCADAIRSFLTDQVDPPTGGLTV